MPHPLHATSPNLRKNRCALYASDRSLKSQNESVPCAFASLRVRVFAFCMNETPAKSVHPLPMSSFSLLSPVKFVHFVMAPRFFLLVLVCASIAAAAEPEVDPKDLPRFPAVEAAEAAKTFVIREGFKVELAASEPNVVSP